MAKSAAAKQESGDSDDKVDLFIAQYQLQYSEAISYARDAAATTSTVAWKASYRKNLDDHRAFVKTHIGRIENVCNMINGGDTTEDFEKDIRDSVKALAEERVRFGAWRTRAVQNYESSAIHCQELIHTVMRKASDSERDNPLVDHGLTVGVQDRINKWPRAEWDDENGQVTIDERKGEKPAG